MPNIIKIDKCPRKWCENEKKIWYQTAIPITVSVQVIDMEFGAWVRFKTIT